MDNISTIIIDTNIIQYLNYKYIQKDLDNYINNFINQNIKIILSEISIVEAFSGIQKEKEEDTIRKISKFKNISLYREILYIAAHLQSLYHKEKIPFQHISLADRIIAATAIYTNSSILTADINDYPRPFFTEIEEKLFLYKYKNSTHLRVLQLLKPNYSLLTSYFVN